MLDNLRRFLKLKEAEPPFWQLELLLMEDLSIAPVLRSRPSLPAIAALSFPGAQATGYSRYIGT